MGQSTSNASIPRRTLYPASKYLWTDNVLAGAIASGALAPVGGSTPDCTPANPAECQICYRYYSTVNKMSCCGGIMCTECLTVVAPPPPKPNACPFCRRANVRTHVCSGAEADSHDDQAFRAYEERRRLGLEDTHLQGSQEHLTTEQEQLVESIVARTGIERYVVRDLVLAGLDEEEILANLR